MLTRKECSALRGIAILAIMLHNYCHWLRLAVKENEYTFSSLNNSRLIEALTHPDWNLPVHLLSYFGHYGVPVFLFLSGYGLVTKYEKASPDASQGEKGLPWMGWARYHYLKLFRIMIVGYVLFLMVDFMTSGPHHYASSDVVAQLLMVNNLMPQPDKIIWPGPFWFFGLMMQLYIVYRLLIYRRHWSNVLTLIIICCVIQGMFIDDTVTLMRLRYNCLCGLLPFGLGVLTARFCPPDISQLKKWQWAVIALVAIILMFFLSLNAYLWLWAPIAVIAAVIAIVKLTPARVLEWLVWTGGISAAMFVAHPTLRKIFIPISHRGDVYTGLLLYIIASFVVSWIVMMIINKMPKPKL